MGFYQISEQMLNTAFTLNGDKAYTTTGSACLDYFSIIGGKRHNLVDALNLFMKSYYEDPRLTIKILFYVRDIRDGLGERSIFRYTFNALANMYPDVASQLIKYIPEYGRYDDLLVCLNSPIKKIVLEYIDNQLKEDLTNKQNGKPISLLAKWLPSINTSSIEARNLASIIASSLKMKKEEYRKTLSYLRKGLIIENNLREVDYSFDYEKVPSNAMFKYRNAFINHDRKRYLDYLEDVKTGKSKINTATLYPYEIIRRLDEVENRFELDSLDVMWKSFNRSEITSKTIVVRDGSGSMTVSNNGVSPLDVATSLAILFAEQLTGEFKDTFITFSSSPKIVKIKGDTIKEKYDYISNYRDCSNTDIYKVYKLILDVYKHKNFKKEDAIDRIVIISDMEFDCVGNASKSTFEKFKEEFSNLGYDIPEVVFWNVYARKNQFPTINEEGVKLISGSSSKIIDMVTNNKTFNAYEFMLKCLEKYSCFDEIKL